MTSAPAPLEMMPAPAMTQSEGIKTANTSETSHGDGGVSGGGNQAPMTPASTTSTKSNYKGFVAGVFSGIAKLSGELIETGPCWIGLEWFSSLVAELFLSVESLLIEIFSSLN